MSDEARRNFGRRLRRADFLIMLLCLCGAVCSVILFRLDLSGNEKPVGTVIVGNNIVQRRMANRALWDRLAVDSHVYAGDYIRTAALSDTTLYIERNSIDLKEKTHIRIQRSPEDEDTLLIYLDEGNLVLSTAPGGGNIALSIMGRQVETGQGTVLSASVGKDGAIVQVSEGTATLVGGGQRREITSGTMIALDSSGAEQAVKIAAVPQSAADASSRIEQGGADLALPKSVAEQPDLPAPLNRLPPEGHRIGIEQLKESDSIVFSWSAAPGANAYIFTLYQDTSGGRRQIIHVPPGNRRNWTLENLATLGRGTFFWQVEAVNMDSAGTIERRGTIGENSFIIDIPRAGQVQIE